MSERPAGDPGDDGPASPAADTASDPPTGTAAAGRGRFAAIAAVILLAAGVYVFWDVARPFNETDEFWYGGIVREMMQSGDFILTRFAGEPDFNKPPLFYWACIPLAAALPMEVAIRVLPGAGLLLAIVTLLAAVRPRFGERAALLAAALFVLCFTHQHFHVWRSGVLDGPFNLAFAAVYWCNLDLPRRPSRLRWIALLIAVAFFMKTAFAVLPAALTAVNLALLRGRTADGARLRPALLAQSAAIVVAVPGAWLLAALARAGPDVAHQAFIVNVWDRFSGGASAFSLGRDELLFIPRHLLAWGQPLALLAIAAIPAALAAVRGPAAAQTPPAGAAAPPAETPAAVAADRRRAVLLAVTWIGMVLGLLELSSGVWCWYASSALFPAAVLVGWHLDRFLADEAAPLGWAVWGLAAAALFLFELPFRYNPYDISSGGAPLTALGPFLATAAAAVAAFGLLARSRSRRPAASALLFRVFAAAALARALLEWTPPTLIATVAIAWIAFEAAPRLLRHPAGARCGVVAAVLVVGAGYLAAPLRWAVRDNVRGDVARVETMIANGMLDREQRMTGISRYTFVALYYSYGDRLDVRLDESERVIFIGPKR